MWSPIGGNPEISGRSHDPLLQEQCIITILLLWWLRSYCTWNAMHLSKLLSFWYCMDKHHSTSLCVPLTGLRDWPVQPSNTLLMKNSMKSRECALVWHQVWSQSLCLYHNPINSAQLVWWELTYLVQVNIPNIKSFDEEFNPDFL
jgi:hypothetical protein